MAQTFIININPDAKFKEQPDRKWDFFRVGCKRISTCKKYIKSWVDQAKQYHSLYKKTLLAEGATFSIEDNNRMVVAEGLISDL